MPTISQGSDLLTVIVTVDAEPAVLQDMRRHAQVGLEHFGECDGFVAGALHLSDDGSRMVQYLQWSSEEAYRACLEDPRWDALPTTAPFLEAVASGKARMDARLFTVMRAVP